MMERSGFTSWLEVIALAGIIAGVGWLAGMHVQPAEGKVRTSSCRAASIQGTVSLDNVTWYMTAVEVCSNRQGKIYIARNGKPGNKARRVTPTPTRVCYAPCTVVLPEGTAEDDFRIDFTHEGYAPVLKVWAR